MTTPERSARISRKQFVRAAGAAGGAFLFPSLGGRAAAATRVRFPAASEFDADVPVTWFDFALDLVRATGGYSPPVASRALGCAGLTLYEAIAPGMAGYRSLARVLPGLDAVPGAGKNAAYDWPTVANTALAAILRQLFRTAPNAKLAELDALEARLAARLQPSLPPGVATRSTERGREVAAALFDWSRSDGGHEGYLRNFPPYDPPVGPGLWVRTPPGLLPALQPFWGRNRCLVLPGGDVCPPGDHPPFSNAVGSSFYAEALEVYEAKKGLTSEQEAIARFWSDDPAATATPPGHSISITTQVLRQESADLATAAEAYARVGAAIFDAFVACWYQKYVYNLLRPVTYIQRNLEPGWLPLLVTPPFPEYPSGHSVQSGAAFTVLTDLFGDDYAFVDHTHDGRGLAPRAFGSFNAAAEEAALSRLYGGIHFRAAISNGLGQGRCIGRAASALPLQG